MARALLSPRLALVLLPAAFVVPLISSPFGGANHAVVCTTDFGEPVSVIVGADTGQVAGSALSIDQQPEVDSACAGVDLFPTASAESNGTARVILPVLNNRPSAIRATLEIRLNGRTSVQPLGRIPTGGVRTHTIRLKELSGTTEVQARVLVGPG